MKKVFIIVVAVILCYTSKAQDYPTAALNNVETEILNLVNDYRSENGLPELKISQALCYVADIHAKDLFYNKPQDKCGSLNSWSNKGNWKSLCYLKDRNAVKNMKKKPSEITNYKGQSIEIAYFNDGIVNPNDVVNSWKLFPQFDNVMLNLQPYASPKWEVMGIAEFNGYVCLWFGPTQDKAIIMNIDRNSYPSRTVTAKVPVAQEKEVEISTTNNKQDEQQQVNEVDAVIHQDVAPSFDQNEMYYIVVFSSSDLNNSITFVNDLIKKGYKDAEMVKTDNKIRICVQKFNTHDEAEKYKNTLIRSTDFKDAWILKK